jgi:hypothetical protein
MTDRKKLKDPDEFGIGMTGDGKLNVVSPEEHAARTAERDAEEQEDGDVLDIDGILAETDDEDQTRL